MGPLKGKSANPKKTIDVRQCTSEVANYLSDIEAQLTNEQIVQAHKLVDKRRDECIAWVEEQTHKNFKFVKHEVLEKLSDKCVEEMPDVHRDYFRHKLHYVSNGVQHLVDKRKKVLRNAKHPSVASPAPPLTSPAAAPATTPTPPVAVSPSHAIDVNQHADSGSEEEDGDDVTFVNTVMEADQTIIEATQTFEVAPSPSTNELHVTLPETTDASVQTDPPPYDKRYCIPTCTVGGEQGSLDMVRCIICMRWCHQVCCDDEEEFEYEASVWTCPTCRTLPSDLLAMKKQLTHVTSLLLSLSSKMENIEKKTAVSAVQASVTPKGPPVTPQQASHAQSLPQPEQSDDTEPAETVKQKPAAAPSAPKPPGTSTTSAHDSTWKTKKQKRPPAPAEKPKLTARLFCDSIPKKIDKQYLTRKCSVDVKLVQNGFKMGPLVDHIMDEETECETPVIIHTGTNHIVKESAKRTIDRFIKLEYNLARRKFQRVLLSSIVYRGDCDAESRENIKLVNTRLHMMCNKNKWTFIDNDNIDETCLDADGIHLNGMGHERLTMNIAKGLNALHH
jgi:hypothetical protein